MSSEPAATSPGPPSPPPAARPLLEQPLVRLAIAAVVLAVLGGAALAVRASRSGGSSHTEVCIAPPLDAVLGPIGGGEPVLQQPAPDFALAGCDGSVVRLSDYRGKVVWVNFWATWCVPCRQELPDIQALSNEFKDKGLVVLTVNYKEGGADAKAFFSRYDLSLPFLLDAKGSVYDEYQLTGLPDSFFVDRDGILQARQFGSFTPETMRERLAAAGLQ